MFQRRAVARGRKSIHPSRGDRKREPRLEVVVVERGHDCQRLVDGAPKQCQLRKWCGDDGLVALGHHVPCSLLVIGCSLRIAAMCGRQRGE